MKILNEQIKLLVFDVDGVLTDGKLIYTNSGDIIKEFNVSDGFAIDIWNRKLKRISAIITGKKSDIVQRRGEELGVQYIYQGIGNKVKIIDEILNKENLKWENVAIIGDDINDFNMLSKANIAYTPLNGVSYLNKIENIKRLKKSGGMGAVREMIEEIVGEEQFAEVYFSSDLKTVQ